MADVIFNCQCFKSIGGRGHFMFLKYVFYISKRSLQGAKPPNTVHLDDVRTCGLPFLVYFKLDVNYYYLFILYHLMLVQNDIGRTQVASHKADIERQAGIEPRTLLL